MSPTRPSCHEHVVQVRIRGCVHGPKKSMQDERSFVSSVVLMLLACLVWSMSSVTKLHALSRSSNSNWKPNDVCLGEESCMPNEALWKEVPKVEEVNICRKTSIMGKDYDLMILLLGISTHTHTHQKKFYCVIKKMVLASSWDKE